MASDTQAPPARHLSGAAANWGIHARRMCALRLGPLQCSTVSLVMMAVPAATSNATSWCSCCDCGSGGASCWPGACCCRCRSRCCCCPSSSGTPAPACGVAAPSRRQSGDCRWLPGFILKQPFSALMSSRATHTAAVYDREVCAAGEFAQLSAVFSRASAWNPWLSCWGACLLQGPLLTLLVQSL